MSRFFAAGSDSESSGSESDVSLESFSSQESKVSEQVGKSHYNEFLKGAGSDSDSDDDKKIVKSQKEKRMQEMRTSVEGMADGLDDSNWLQVENEYDTMQKLLSRSATMIKLNGLPRFYVRILTRLQKCIAEESTEDVKKMNPSTAKSYNAMKQKVKKAYKSHQADIDRFLENPVDELESEEERELMLEKQDESDDESDKAQKPAAVLSADVKLTSIDIFTNLDDILQARGKKNTDKVAQIDQLILLLAAAFTPYQKVKLLMSLIPARFDSVLANSGVMSLQMWKAAMDEINSLHDILSANPHITIGHAPEIDEDEDVIKDQKATVGGPVCIHGIITSFVDRLDDEYTKYLQNIDPQSLEYIERLKDEIPLYTTLIRIQKYAENSGISKQQIDLITLRRVEHLYYKPDLLIAALETSCPKSDIKNVLSKLCSTLIKSADERVRARSILCRIYQMALYDKFSEAKDWMLMSRMQETISQLDVGTQILFNRAMVQIGICAFRCGLFSEAHTCLQEIASSGKSRELLGQGISSQRAADKSPEQEKLEKQRQLPFHMHVNLEVVECAYLTSAMLLEVPNMAQHAQDSRRKAISKSFRRMLDYHERQVFTGPAENLRDHIMAASKSMGTGDWQACVKYINAIKVWDHLPNSSNVKKMLNSKVQSESLRTYVFNSSQLYESYRLEALAAMFGLDIEKVVAILAKMILKNELNASIDRTTMLVYLDDQPSTSVMSRIDYLAGIYSDKLNGLIDSNEKLLEAKCVQLGLAEAVVAPHRPRTKKAH